MNNLDLQIQKLTYASIQLTEAVIAYLNAQLASATPDDLASPDWGDKVFSAIWDKLNCTGMVHNRLPHGVFAFAQATEGMTSHVMTHPWADVHKGVHFYNVGLSFISLLEVDRAFRFFLLADEQDERNKGSEPGDIFRSKVIFDDLRARFFGPWMTRTTGDYHWSPVSTPDERLQLLVRLLSALPGRAVLARCHLGVFRACVLYHQAYLNLPRWLNTDYLLAVEDLAVLTEAVCRMLHEGKTAYDNDKLTLGSMLKGNTPVGDQGFILPTPILALQDEHASRQVLASARQGEKRAMSAVVHRFRNLTAHPGDPEDWCLDPVVLADVVAVQLDFATAIATAYEGLYGVLPTLLSVQVPPASSTASTSLPDSSEVATFASSSSGQSQT